MKIERLFPFVLSAVLALSPCRNAEAQYGAQPQAAQLVMLLNNALQADMNPVSRENFAQAFAGVMRSATSGLPTGTYAQQALAGLKQLSDAYGSQPGDDNHRLSLCLLLTIAGMSGVSAENIRLACMQTAAGYVQRGETWPTSGNFGAVLQQLPSMSFGGNAFGGGGFPFGGGGGGGGSFGGSSGGTCPVCHGTGACTVCHGTGSVRQYGQTVPCDRACSACGGTGRR